MKFFSILVLLGSVTSLNSKSCNKQKPFIMWSDTKKLEWAHFQAPPNPSDNFVASSSVKIQLDYKVGEYLKEYDVVCLFFKNESWTVDNTSYGLNHEQRHFDIGEIFARQLRKSMEENKQRINSYNVKLIDSLYSYYRDELIKEQARYDSATRHSLNRFEQEDWNIKIDAQLDSLKMFRRRK